MNPYHPLPRLPLVSGRHDLILSRCRGQRVLHIGCVDAGLLEERFRRGELMHQRLAAVSGELWGVDIHAEGIAFLRQQGFDHLVTGDMSDPAILTQLPGGYFDVCVASEVIEHLLNPGLFLQNIKKLMIPEKTELIITTPNAYRIETILSLLLQNIEFIHPDHNFWFSYVTLTNLVRKSGLRVEEVYVYTFQPTTWRPAKARPASPSRPGAETRRLDSWRSRLARGPRRLVSTWLLRRHPCWGDGFIVIARAPADERVA